MWGYVFGFHVCYLASVWSWVGDQILWNGPNSFTEGKRSRLAYIIPASQWPCSDIWFFQTEESCHPFLFLIPCFGQYFHLWDVIPNTHRLKLKKFIWIHKLGHSLPAPSQNSMTEENCSCLSHQEVEREVQEIHPFRSQPHWLTCELAPHFTKKADELFHVWIHWCVQ